MSLVNIEFKRSNWSELAQAPWLGEMAKCEEWQTQFSVTRVDFSPSTVPQKIVVVEGRTSDNNLAIVSV